MGESKFKVRPTPVLDDAAAKDPAAAKELEALCEDLRLSFIRETDARSALSAWKAGVGKSNQALAAERERLRAVEGEVRATLVESLDALDDLLARLPSSVRELFVVDHLATRPHLREAWSRRAHERLGVSPADPQSLAERRGGAVD